MVRDCRGTYNANSMLLKREKNAGKFIHSSSYSRWPLIILGIVQPNKLELKIHSGARFQLLVERLEWPSKKSNK